MGSVTYQDFAEWFPLADTITGAEPVPASLLPEPYAGMLNHTKHMTVTVEKYFGDRVNVVVEDWDRNEDLYTRRIILRTQRENLAVQFGIVQINLAVLPPHVRSQILEHAQPLGRVLIENQILTDVHPVQFLKVSLGPRLAETFQVDFPNTTYGRIGHILANGQSAIDVLEILRPLDRN